MRVAPDASEACSGSAPVCSSPSPSSPASSSITIAFGAQIRMMIEGEPDAATLANVIRALTALDRFR